MPQRRIAAIAIALVATFAVACAKEADQQEAPAARYQVRGQIDAIDGRKLYVFHEAMPEFVGRSGEVVGMESMQMPFGAGQGVDLSQVAVGDKVSMTVDVRFSDDPPLTIVKLEKLPADTALELAR